MKYKFRNRLLLLLGVSCVALSAPVIEAKDEKAPAKAEKAPAKGAKKAAAAKDKHKKGPALTAASLVTDMRKAEAFIAKSAKDKISRKSKEARPFWSALEDCSKALDQIESGQKAKDASMLKGLEALGRALPELSASWGVLRGSHKDLQVGRGVIAFSKAYDTYLLHFGPAVARHKKGGEVSEAEKSKLTKSRAKVKELKAQIAACKSKAKPKSYELRLLVDLVNLCAELDKITGSDLNAYTKYCYQLDRLTYMVDGYGNIFEVWYPDTYKSWSTVSKSCDDIYVEFSSGYYAYYEGWDYSSVSVSSYSDYYEVTSVSSSITTEEISTYESYSEEYTEESATEESSEETAEINEEVAVDESDEDSFADEVETGADDEDADGIEDDKDTDDDNDGTADEADNDDDGDGVADADDADSSDEADDDDSADDDGDADDDGMADDDDGDDGGDEEMDDDSGDDGDDGGDDGGDDE